jgi:hypothetical protein
MSSSSKKVIQIKPELFKMQKTKTIKAGKKITTPIDTSKIKEQLTANILKRRKQKFKADAEIEKKKADSEFDKSFNFMLEEKEKEREVKEKNLKRSIKNQAKREDNPVLVNVEWTADSVGDNGLSFAHTWNDKELQEVPIENMTDSMLSYKLDKEINYGCLKGGLKKTFKNLNEVRVHNKTISSNRVKFYTESEPTPSQAPVIISPPVPVVVPVPAPIVQQQQQQQVLPPPLITPIAPPTIISTGGGAYSEIKNVNIQEPLTQPEYIPPPITIHTNPSAVPVEITSDSVKHLLETEEIKVPSIKETVKRKTIKHRYKLGKSKTLQNRISVLSTSKSRIKQIQDAKRELQKTSMEKMKKYLMDRNLLSSGSAAPPDVIKKMYEEANITADITNHDDDKLLENYLDKH